MSGTLLLGIVVVACVAVLSFLALRWRSANAATPVSGVAASADVATADSSAKAARAEGAAAASADPRPARLELRGVGLRIDIWAQTDVWQLLKEQKDAYRSVLSTNPADYPRDASRIQEQATGALGSSFRYCAGEGVERWPIPVVVFGPPKAADINNPIANLITTNRQRASLPLHMFLTAQAANVANPQAQIDYLFDFFAANPRVPELLVYGVDGEAVRSWFEHVSVPDGPRVPSQFDAMAGLLVARSDRVDAYVRPFVNGDPQGAGPDDRQYDTIKAANFYWNVNAEPKEGLDVSPPTVAQWQAKAPLLTPELDNSGPGSFVPDASLPSRWARWQLEEFDAAPLLGYLHRPVAIRLTDGSGQPLKGTARTVAVRDGWQAVRAQLPAGETLARVFFDSLAQPAVLPLLHLPGIDDVPDPTSLGEGFDVGRRIGGLGIMGPMVGLGLSAMAGYELGHGSVTANLAPDGQLHLILVTPPDAAGKAANVQDRKLPADPFVHLVPGG
ncbi:type VI lipase adapter Tla3 domain-containing protein [Paraburkholderia nemoris]|uniref:type VI lipase adapter Tla3 domain-containing protein n=1 Tax=Paraburkholderia nemoris TaxID=2793076 RepID=UPI0038B93A3D